MLIDTSNRKIRQEYKNRKREHKLALDDAFLKMKIDVVNVSTNNSYVRPLMNFFQRRMSRY